MENSLKSDYQVEAQFNKRVQTIYKCRKMRKKQFKIYELQYTQNPSTITINDVCLQ